MTTTRAEHMEWCKERALAYVDRGDFRNAIASMISDLSKHPETETLGGSALLTAMLAEQSPSGIRGWIEGFAA